MPNPWGCSLPSLQFYYGGLIGAADVACPAGTETNIFQATGAVAWGPGSYVPAVLGSVAVTLGATPPTDCRFALRQNNGADMAYVIIPTALLIANATVMVPLCLFGNPSSSTLWYPNGANIQVACTPTGGAVTAKNIGSQIYYSVWRVQDGS